MRQSELDRLRATAEQLLAPQKLDLFDVEHKELNDMDRAERKARERAQGTDRTEEQIQRRANTRRVFRAIGGTIGKVLISFGLKKAQAKIDKF